MILRKYLHKSGYRYRINYPLFGKPDIVFPKQKIAIFVNGCFWHQHGCKNSVIPKTRRVFWKDKLAKNIERDRIVNTSLTKTGWDSKIIWECELEEIFETNNKKKHTRQPKLNETKSKMRISEFLKNFS